MGHLTSQARQQELEWRRSQVLQYSSQGYSIREIAQKLQIAKSSIDRDLQFLKQQARNNLQNHIHEVVPMEFERCMLGMKLSLKQILEIAESAADPKTKLQAHAIAIDIYKNIMDLTTNGVVVTDAIKYVNSKMDHLNTAEKKLLQDIKDKGNTESEDANEELETSTEIEQQQPTHNGVF